MITIDGEADSVCSEYISGDRTRKFRRDDDCLCPLAVDRGKAVLNGMQGRLIGAAYIVQQPPVILLLRRNLSRIPLLPLSIETTDACVVS